MSSSPPNRKRCPYLLGDECLEDECMFWVKEALCPDPLRPNVVEMVWDCMFIHQYRVARDTARFSDQAGAAINDLRNHVVESQDEISKLLNDDDTRRLEHNG